MGFDDIFKKRKERRKRSKEFLEPKINSFLIVTEGKCTEPNYFRGIQELIKNKIGGTIDIVEAPELNIQGCGMATMRLVKKTNEIVKNAKIIYQNVWIVFDKDDFEDFDNAIIEGEKKGYNIAWSNQSFEYWLYLHFSYSDTPLHRSDWQDKLNKLFKENNISNRKYEKNNKKLFEVLNSFGGPELAVKHAKKRMKKYTKDSKPSCYNPGTTVHKLVESLMNYLN